MDEFFAYLDDIETIASQVHLAKVKEVYGEEWLKPFTGLYTWRDEDAEEKERN